MVGRERAAFLGAVASVLLHGALAAVLIRLPAPSVAGAELAYEVELSLEGRAQPGARPAEGSGHRRSERPSPLEPGGRASAQNIDSRDRGQGGEAVGAPSGILLFHEADTITLTDAPLNALGPMQTQRIRTARDRATRDRRRATPNPDDQPFLASGDGIHRERRPVSRTDAAEGARDAPVADRRGADAVAPRREGAPSSAPAERGVGLPPPSAGSAEQTGGRLDSPGVGIDRGRGRRASEAAHVAHGRPPVDRGPAATPAEAYDHRIRDDRDAELRAAHLVQSLTESTRRMGPVAGDGIGGVGGGGVPGSGGGRRGGGRASAHGPGQGDHASLDADRRYVRWLLEQRRRIADRLRFPRARMLAMDQGTTVCRVRVRRDGTFARPPEMLRSSGFGDLDHAALAAIEAAAPFAPIPAGLAPRVDVLSVTLPVRFENPMVGR